MLIPINRYLKNENIKIKVFSPSQLYVHGYVIRFLAGMITQNI